MTTNALTLVASEHPWLDRAQYPFANKRFVMPADVGGGTLSYVDEGQGPPILFVHGTPSWSFEWRHVISALRTTHRCVALDHLGFGLSDKPADAAQLRPEDHARRLQALVAKLDLRDYTLVVHDFGGPIGLPLALADDTRCRRVVVLNTWMWSSEGDRNVARIDRFVRSWLGRFLYRHLGFSARVLLPSAFGDKRRLTKPVHRQYLAPLSSVQAREGTYAFACALRGSDAFYAALWSQRDKLTRMPLTIVWGARDPLLTNVYRDRWAQTFLHARLVDVADAGHFVAEERPDALIEVLRAGAH